MIMCKTSISRYPKPTTESIEESIGKINKALQNLYKLAEVADDTTELEERLVKLQLQKRDLEKLYHGAASTEEKQTQLRQALERFETWANIQRQFLDDPHTDQPSLINGRRLFLGIKATVYPEKDNPKRIKLELMPPNMIVFKSSSRVSQ